MKAEATQVKKLAIVAEDQDGLFLEVVDASEFDVGGLLPLGTELCRLADAVLLRDQAVALAKENQELRERLQLGSRRVCGFNAERSNATGMIAQWLRAYGGRPMEEPPNGP
ncbi:hypothetical protein [Metapseudomonas otitidis]|uniref:hypothetical protein n=1 Tax=Metapseudomonas otitidis TaxID=319939 RepID=UPI0013F6592D|nr:hypothetical protein [Pseudomonas otitidis]